MRAEQSCVCVRIECDASKPRRGREKSVAPLTHVRTRHAKSDRACPGRRHRHAGALKTGANGIEHVLPRMIDALPEPGRTRLAVSGQRPVPGNDPGTGARSAPIDSD
jgi:hypothetical protein